MAFQSVFRVIVSLLILLMLQLFIGDLLLVRFMADDASADGSHDCMVPGIVARDRARSAAAHASDRLGLGTCTYHYDQSCGNHDFLHYDTSEFLKISGETRQGSHCSTQIADHASTRISDETNGLP